jgi:mutator protein MutT
MVKRIATAIILNNKEEILLQKKTLDYARFPGKWTLFGGEIEEGESAEEAVLRELKEEVGLDFREVSFLKKTLWGDYEEHLFLTKFNFEIKDIRLCEGSGFAFFGEGEILDLDIIEAEKERLKEYLNISA